MKRRDFIKTTALAGLGVGLAGCIKAEEGSFAKSKVTKGERRASRKKDGKARMHLSFFPYELQLQHTFTVASYSRTTTPDVQVEIEYDGYVGYGEASMPPYLGHTVESVCAFLQKVNLEQFSDPFQLEDILAYVDGLSEGDAPAKAAIDIALHDLVGKLIGQPWWRLWGLDAAKAPSTTFTIGIDTPEVVREKTLECADRFNILKVKVGLDSDEEMISTIRSVTDLPLAVDANQGWKDRQKALDEIFWLKEQGVVMVEQPMAVDRIDDIAWITERSPLPIFADESIQRLRDIPAIKGAFTGINIKLMKCTGMREAWKMLNYARAEGMRVMIGCMTETSCACTAAAQLSPAVDFADLDGNLLISNDRFTGMTVRDGRMVLPDRPGLGLIKL
ncbi:MAG: twin-arginine translocation signal domain-containing protein [Bacteroidales bacterium]|nr:twin-arginine translocation signal domain-containing protein [Bacteroidales bacterium]